jgi:hypothetical protein
VVDLQEQYFIQSCVKDIEVCFVTEFSTLQVLNIPHPTVIIIVEIVIMVQTKPMQKVATSRYKMSSFLVNLEAAANTCKLTFFLPDLTNVS